MGKVWREYGVITILLVVAVGGYLLLTRSDSDLLASTMDRLTEHLISLVPDAEGKELTGATLAELRVKVADKEVTPAQLERFTASVLNAHSIGEDMDHEQADMIIRMALEDESEISALSARPPDVATLPTPATPPSVADLDRVGKRMDEVVRMYSDVRRVAPPDKAVRNAPAVLFRADRGLRIVMDERLRSRMTGVYGGSNTSPEMVEWQWELAESLQEERQHQWDEAEELLGMAENATEGVTDVGMIKSLAMLRQLESRGLITHPAVESLAVALKSAILQEMGEMAISIGSAAAAASAGTSIQVITAPPSGN